MSDFIPGTSLGFSKENSTCICSGFGLTETVFDTVSRKSDWGNAPCHVSSKLSSLKSTIYGKRCPTACKVPSYVFSVSKLEKGPQWQSSFVRSKFMFDSNKFVTKSIRYPRTQAPTASDYLLSLYSSFLFSLPFLEEESSRYQVNSLSNFSKSKLRHAEWLSPVGSGVVYRGGGIHNVAYHFGRPSLSRQKNQARSALVWRLYDNGFSSRLHARTLEDPFWSLIPLSFLVYPFMILIVLS